MYIPYKCPSCPDKAYYGKLIAKGDEIPKCPNCGHKCVPAKQ